MKKLLISILSVVAFTAATASIAATSAQDVNKTKGFYVAGALGYGQGESIGKIPTTTGFTVKSDKNGFSFLAALGYRFNNYVAVEGGYIFLPGYKLTVTRTSDNQKADANLYPGLVYVAVKGIMPIGKAFDMFVKAGGGYGFISNSTNNVSVSSHDFIPLVGAGATYHFTPKLAVDAQVIYVIDRDGFPSSTTGLVGLVYNF